MSTPPMQKRVILVGPSGLTGRYYALTKWRDHGNDRIEAVEKHDVTDAIERLVAEARRAGAAEALRAASVDPSLRLSGHSGISIARLRARAETGADR